MKEERKIEFKDLDIWLKIAAIISWLVLASWIFAFSLGFLEGFIGAMFNG